ncbi:hypothetical protein DSO57_1004850 [Entomophthora muscae]|uniref:Uncharacterized protein n=1 Tax=Entomophthora muscae TaxID=34485 RepID=A0ACC2RZ58_9FUNG|nr:hypothetical protein DSO57_1004850 [Entomophthora muscae]
MNNLYRHPKPAYFTRSGKTLQNPPKAFANLAPGVYNNTVVDVHRTQQIFPPVTVSPQPKQGSEARKVISLSLRYFLFELTGQSPFQ